jgi:hypothetical protein
MHRSGTSAITGCLKRMGVNIGSKWMIDLYELSDMVDSNEALLNDMGSSWDDLFRLPKSWWHLPVVEEHRQKTIQIIEREFPKHTIWAFKDPRVCILLPLWMDIFRQLSIEPHFFIIIRNPFEIARSLRMRDGFCQSKSLVLWMKYLLSAEYYTRGYKRVLCRFDELIAAPAKTVRNIFEKCHLKLPDNWKKVSQELNNFIKPDLRHHNTTNPMDEEAGLPPLFHQLYQMLFSNDLQAEAIDRQNCTLDNLREQFEMFQDFFLNQTFQDQFRRYKEKKKEMFNLAKDIVNQFVQNKQFDLVTEILDKLIVVFPEYPSIWNNHAMAHELKGNCAIAVRSLKKAIELNPDYTLARSNLHRVEKRNTD